MDADADDSGRLPGTAPYANYIPCDNDDECPNFSGDCITEVSFNRSANGSPRVVTIAELDPSWPKSGVCSTVCSDQVNACDALRLPGAPDVPYACQVVAVGAPPYALDGSGALPDPATLDPGQQTLGVPFAALCMPPFRATTGFGPDFCEPCSAANACEPGSVCWLDAPFALEPSTTGTCLTACGGAEGGCPFGFDCATLDSATGSVLGGAGEGSFCVPKSGTCGTCRDADGDGFGTGLCDGNNATPHDCDDAVATTWFDTDNMNHAFPTSCGETLDANCNGVGDLSDQVGTEVFGATHCTTCGDACGGVASHGERVCEGGAAAPRCGVRCESDSFVDCDGDPTNGCEVENTDPSRVFYADCDGDGVPQDGVPRFDCAGTGLVTVRVGLVDCAGVPETDIAVGTAGLVFDCDDADSANTPEGMEVCDGQDNDCNDIIDDTATLVGASLRCTAPGALGTCASNGHWSCDSGRTGTGPDGETCMAAPPATKESCDGLDDDCDGAVDDGPTEGEGALCTAPEAKGLCATTAAFVCQSGALACVAGTPAATDLPGDGTGPEADTNCDGFDGDLSRAVFVKPLGCTTNCDGTMARPVASLEAAYQLIAARRLSGPLPLPNQVILTVGTFYAPFGLRFHGSADAESAIVGGYERSVDGVFEPGGGRSTIRFSDSPTPSLPAFTLCGEGQVTCNPGVNGFVAAIDVVDPRDVLLQQIDVVVAKPQAGFGHIAGLSCRVSSPLESCLGLHWQDISVTVDEGADGVAGSPGIAGANGVGGVVRGSITTNFFSETGTVQFAAAAGASSSCSAAGGDGGYASSSAGYHADDCRASCGAFCCLGYFDAAFTDLTGYRSSGGAGASPLGGAGGGFSDTVVVNCYVSILRPELDGSPGRPSDAVAPGGNGGAIAFPTGAGPGFSGGAGGSGGGGGGGGGLAGADRMNDTDVTLYAASGAGGASGGCGGIGGSGGSGGGAIIGLVWDDVANPNLTGLEVTVGQGGAGGVGGIGGAAGNGGPQSFFFSDTGQGSGIGAPGGNGSSGGGGGGGGGGWAISIARRRGSVVGVEGNLGVGRGGEGGAGGQPGAVSSTAPKYRFSSAALLPSEALDLSPASSWQSAVGLVGEAGASGGASVQCFLDTTAPLLGVPNCFSTCRAGSHAEGAICVADVP